MPAALRRRGQPLIGAVIHAERTLVWHAVHLGVDEVGDPAEAEGDGDGNYGAVRDLVEPGFAGAAEQPRDERDAGQAAMKSQPALPYREPRPWPVVVLVELEDEDVEEASADDRAKKRPADPRLDGLLVQVVELTGASGAHEVPADQDEPEEVGKGIPADPEVAVNANKKGIEVVNDALQIQVLGWRRLGARRRQAASSASRTISVSAGCSSTTVLPFSPQAPAAGAKTSLRILIRNCCSSGLSMTTAQDSSGYPSVAKIFPPTLKSGSSMWLDATASAKLNAIFRNWAGVITRGRAGAGAARASCARDSRAARGGGTAPPGQFAPSTE